MLFFWGFLLRVIFIFLGYSFDLNNHMGWGKETVLHGFSGFYDRVLYGYTITYPNYPPLPYYLFHMVYLLYRFINQVAWFINIHLPLFPSKLIFFLESNGFYAGILKIPFILADIGIAYLLYRLTNKKLAAFFVILNPIFWYISALWGQIESLSTFFLLGSYYCLVKKNNPVLSLFAFTLALLSKQTVVVFIPVFLALFFNRYRLLDFIKGIGISVGAFWLLFLPFFGKGNIFLFPFEIYIRRILFSSGLPFVSNHAFNVWPLITGWNNILDTNMLGPLPFRVWGYIAFGTCLLIICLPFIMKKFVNEDIYYLAFFLSGISAFLFLTKIHERHLLQALPFLVPLAVKNRKYFYIFITITLIGFFNLYHNFAWPEIKIFVATVRNPLVPYVLIPPLLGLFFIVFGDYLKSVNVRGSPNVKRRLIGLKGKDRY